MVTEVYIKKRWLRTVEINSDGAPKLALLSGLVEKGHHDKFKSQKKVCCRLVAPQEYLKCLQVATKRAVRP